MRVETEQNKNWEDQKEKERRSYEEFSSSLSGVALALPALMRAQKLQKRASRKGFDWDEITQVFDKLEEEIEVAALVDKLDHEQDIALAQMKLEADMQATQAGIDENRQNARRKMLEKLSKQRQVAKARASDLKEKQNSLNRIH